MEACCALAINPRKDGRIIHETPNFFVSAALGSMGLPGYVLLVSQDHLVGTGDMTRDLHLELDDLMDQTRGVLRRVYGRDPLFFEHGPRVGSCGWGGCIDHAHIHAVPCSDIADRFAVDLMHQLTQVDEFYRVDRKDSFDLAAELYRARQRSYVMLQRPQGDRLFAQIGFPGQSQWMRQLIAQQIQTDHWNWRKHPYHERAMQTAHELSGKFN